MAISMWELFSHDGIVGEVISLRNSLTTHPWGLTLGLREAHQRLAQLTSSDGFARGCRRPDSVRIHYGLGEREVGGVLPAWVPVAGSTRLVRRHGEGRCSGLQSKPAWTAISAFLGPHYLPLSSCSGPHYLRLRLQSAASACNSSRRDHIRCH